MHSRRRNPFAPPSLTPAAGFNPHRPRLSSSHVYPPCRLIRSRSACPRTSAQRINYSAFFGSVLRSNVLSDRRPALSIAHKFVDSTGSCGRASWGFRRRIVWLCIGRGFAWGRPQTRRGEGDVRRRASGKVEAALRREPAAWGCKQLRAAYTEGLRDGSVGNAGVGGGDVRRM